MGPVVAAIQVIATVAAANTIQGFIVRTVLTIASSMLFQALTPKPKGGAAGSGAASGVEQQRQLGEATPRAIALGWTIVAGSEGALWASGDSDDNRYNTRVIVISDWPTTLQKVWVRGREITFEGDINAGWFACNQYRSKTGAARLWMRFIRGDWNQAADPLLVSYANANGSWTSEDRLRGVSALLIRREYDVDAFQSGAPDNDDLRVEVRNAPVYDWRDVTQNVNDVTTWKPSENPVVLVENALCLLRAPAQFSPGSTDPIVGPGLDFSRRPLAKLTAMANICDELVSGQPRYRAGGVVRADMTGRDIIGRFAAACAGSWVSSGEGGYLRPGYVPAPVMDIPAGALQASSSDRYDPWARPDAVVNTVIGSYPDPSQAWQITPLPPASDAAWVATDGGVRAAQEDLSFVPYRDQAWRISTRKARGFRLMGSRDFTGPHWLIELEPGDVVTAPDPTLPYLATKWWMVQRVVLLAKEDGLTVQITLIEIDSAIDAAPPAIGAPASFTPSSLSRALAVPPVTIGQRVVSAASGGQHPELTFLIPDTASQASGMVQLQGPATANTTPALAAGQIRNISLSRGLLHGEPVVPGWYRWRAAGRDVDGSVGAFDAVWQAAVQVTTGTVSDDTSNLRALPNLLPDAQYDRFGDGGSRVILTDTVPAQPVLSRQLDATLGAFTQIKTPAVAAIGGGSFYGVALAPTQSAADAVPIPASRIGYRLQVSAVPASGTLTAAINGYFVRLMGFRETDGVWDTSVDIPLNQTDSSVQTVSGFTDSAVRRRWLIAVWVRVRPGIAIQVDLNVINPALFALPAGQTIIPPWVPSSNAAPRADVTADAVPSVEGPTLILFDVDAAGALSPGSQVPRTLQFIRKRGNVDVSASTTWTIVSPVNITLGAITNGGVNVTAVAAGLSNFTVRSVRDGVTIDHQVTVNKNTIVASGGGGSKIARDDTATGIASGTYSAVLSATINSGPTGLARVELNYLPITWSGASTNFQFRLTRAGVMIAETGVFNGIDGAGDIGDFLTEVAALAGFYSVAAGTAVWALEARRTSGTGTINTAAGELVVEQTET